MSGRFKLGILFVHGIGRQPASETLVRWGDTLIKTIGRATRHRVRCIVEHARSGDPQKGGAEAHVRFEAGGDNDARIEAGSDKERWLVREAWWADSFVAPSYGELVSWSVQAVPWLVAVHVAQRYWQAKSAGFTSATFRALVVELMIGVISVPLVIVGLALLLVLGLLPIPQLRSWIVAAQSALTATIGDSLAFVESPLRAGLIRTRTRESLVDLKAVCERTIVVAHSQGAAVLLDALGAMGLLGARGNVTGNTADCPVPDTLITFGAGTNKLASLKVRRADLPEDARTGSAQAIPALLIALGSLAWLLWGIRTGQTSAAAAGFAFFLFLMWMFTFSVFVSAVHWTVRTLAKWWEAIRKREVGITISITMPVVMGALVLVIWYANDQELPFGAVSLAVGATIVFMGALGHFLGPATEKVLGGGVVKVPRGLQKWIDIYASADPVPNGPTNTNEAKVPRSVPISNVGSRFSDHTAYWDNLDGFVLRVVRACAQTANSPWEAELPFEICSVDERAKWRVWFRRVAWWTTMGATLLAAVSLSLRYRSLLVLPFDLPAWIPPSSSQLAAALALAIAAAWMAAGLVRLVWSRWVRAEQKAVLAHTPPVGNAFWRLVGIGFIVWMALFTAMGLAGMIGSGRDLGALFAYPLAAFGGAWGSTWVLLWLKPPPESEAEPEPRLTTAGSLQES